VPPPAPPPPAHDAPLPAVLTVPSGVRLLAGVPYAAIPGSRPLELDLWLPPITEEHPPVAVFLHGGGWRMGSRHSAGPAFATADPSPFEQVALAGIAVASIDYRLTGEAIWPAQLHDAKAAVRWLRSRSADLGINPDGIAAWGESAGGHLAELLGLVNGEPTLEGDVGVVGPSSRVAAVVAWYAPSDVAAVATDLGNDPMDASTREALLLGAAPAAVPDIAAHASPISQVSTDAVPILLLHGKADRLVPSVQSERLATALLATGADVQLQLYDGADHMWLGTPDTAVDAVARTIAFLRRHLDTARVDPAHLDRARPTPATDEPDHRKPQGDNA
jgi:acetyl esterase/lipase